jgi:hypothetical protein
VRNRPPGLGLGSGIDYAHITEDDAFLGDGLGWTARVEWRLTRNTALEFELSRERHLREGEAGTGFLQPDGSFVPYFFRWRWEGTATFLMGTVTRAFGDSRVRPMIWGGGGLLHHPGTVYSTTGLSQLPPETELPPGFEESRQGRGVTAAAIEGGAGAGVRTGDYLVVRPYAALRLANTGNYGPKYIIRSGVRVMVHW